MNFNISFTGTTENSDIQVNQKMLGTLSKSQFSGISEKKKNNWKHLFVPMQLPLIIYKNPTEIRCYSNPHSSSFEVLNVYSHIQTLYGSN